MKGFTFFYKGKDIFIQTELKNKTDNLARKILRKMIDFNYDIPDNPCTRKELLYYLTKAKCEIKTLPNSRQYYEIYGDNFAGKGSFLDDGNTIIINIDEAK